MLPKKLLNMSRAIGTYGTCAVKVEGEMTAANKASATAAFPFSRFSYKWPMFS
jgi:hypothetical protein